MVFLHKSVLFVVASLPLALGFSSQLRELSEIRTSQHASRIVRPRLVRSLALAADESAAAGKIFEPIGVGVKRDFQRRLPYFKVCL